MNHAKRWSTFGVAVTMAGGFGRNLLDEDGYGIGFDVAGLWSYAAARPPRTFGFEVGYGW